MEAPKQNKPKRKRISQVDNPDKKPVNLSADKVVLDKLIYEKVATVKKEENRSK